MRIYSSDKSEFIEDAMDIAYTLAESVNMNTTNLDLAVSRQASRKNYEYPSDLAYDTLRSDWNW